MTILALVPLFAAVSPVYAEPTCETNFTLITASEAQSVDPDAGALDVNADGWLCRMDTANADGTITTSLVDTVAAAPSTCPDGFKEVNLGSSELAADEPRKRLVDRNGDNIICEKTISAGAESKSVQIDNHQFLRKTP